jgi:hypothetical protein
MPELESMSHASIRILKDIGSVPRHRDGMIESFELIKSMLMHEGSGYLLV